MPVTEPLRTAMAQGGPEWQTRDEEEEEELMERGRCYSELKREIEAWKTRAQSASAEAEKMKKELEAAKVAKQDAIDQANLEKRKVDAVYTAIDDSKNLNKTELQKKLLAIYTDIAQREWEADRTVVHAMALKAEYDTKIARLAQDEQLVDMCLVSKKGYQKVEDRVIARAKEQQRLETERKMRLEYNDLMKQYKLLEGRKITEVPGLLESRWTAAKITALRAADRANGVAQGKKESNKLFYLQGINAGFLQGAWHSQVTFAFQQRLDAHLIRSNDPIFAKYPFVVDKTHKCHISNTAGMLGRVVGRTHGLEERFGVDAKKYDSHPTRIEWKKEWLVNPATNDFKGSFWGYTLRGFNEGLDQIKREYPLPPPGAEDAPASQPSSHC